MDAKTRETMMSSATPEWATPPELFAELDREFNFNLDPCATAENAKCERYFTREVDGLAQPWAPARAFVNPPYGRVQDKWVRKAWEESGRGALVVMLLPARTDTARFHDYIMGKAEIRFRRGRVRFIGPTKDGKPNGATFPSMIVIFHPGSKE